MAKPRWGFDRFRAWKFPIVGKFPDRARSLPREKSRHQSPAPTKEGRARFALLRRGRQDKRTWHVPLIGLPKKICLSKDFLGKGAASIGAKPRGKRAACEICSAATRSQGGAKFRPLLPRSCGRFLRRALFFVAVFLPPWAAFFMAKVINTAMCAYVEGERGRTGVFGCAAGHFRPKGGSSDKTPQNLRAKI